MPNSKKSRKSRGKSSGASSSKSKESVADFKRRMRGQKQRADMEKADYLQDVYEKAVNSKDLIRKQTGITYSDDFMKHKCEWDNLYPEKPERYSSIMKRLQELGLIDRCKFVNIEETETRDILEIHTIRHLLDLKKISQAAEVRSVEEEASRYDSIYFNKHTYDCAIKSCNATVSLVKAVYNGDVTNGLAVVRPPGHHAQVSEFNGYCFLNNVSVAAAYLSSVQRDIKVLIVDWDVHHGQGTQRNFYLNKNTMYFSIHRFENGAFWPNLLESDCNFIGDDEGTGFNVNVPLNSTGLGDSDYMSIVTHILLPMAYEFQPDIILVSAGYDACIGCPEGDMRVTPALYGHIIKLLSGLAQGRIAVILEGGYFLPSLAEGVAMTLRALLDDEPDRLCGINEPHISVIRTINDLKYYHHDFWEMFKFLKLHELVDGTCNDEDGLELHTVNQKFVGVVLKAPFQTRDCYPVLEEDEVIYYKTLIEHMQLVYGKPVPNSVCYAYHDDMLLHSPEEGNDPPEHPGRLEAVYQKFRELKLHERCTDVTETINVDVLKYAKLIHTPAYVEKLMGENYNPKSKSQDLYWKKEESLKSVCRAVSCLINVCDAVVNDQYTSGIALIRPPGHHAETNRCLGFCYMNNVAIAAKYLIDKYETERILIVDFDIHHGNGTQKMFYDTNNVLYISIHKYENGSYFPVGTDGAHTNIGKDKGKGYNVNIPFSQDRMSDPDYLYVFFKIILPIAYSYNPDVVLVSAGFDAGVNDLLGNYKVTPEAFGHMIQLLRPLACGKLIVAMEGGYNLNTLKHSTCLCVKALLGDPLPKLANTSKLKEKTNKVVEQVIAVQKAHWKILDVDRPLPHRVSDVGIAEERLDYRSKDKSLYMKLPDYLTQMHL